MLEKVKIEPSLKKLLSLKLAESHVLMINLSIQLRIGMVIVR